MTYQMKNTGLQQSVHIPTILLRKLQFRVRNIRQILILTHLVYIKLNFMSTQVEFELFQGPHFEFLQQYKAPKVVGLTFYQAFMNGP